MAKQRTQRGAVKKTAPAPVAGDQYKVANLIEDLEGVEFHLQRAKALGWDGVLRAVDAESREGYKRRRIVEQLDEKRKLEAKIAGQPGVARLRLIHEAEGSGAGFLPWLRQRKAQTAIATGDNDGSTTDGRSLDEFSELVAQRVSPQSAKVEKMTEAYFVVMRCWPGFTSRAPIELFNGLSDRDAEQAASAALAEHVWHNRREIRERRQAAYRKWVAGIKRQSKTVLGPPGPFVQKATKSLRSEWRNIHGWRIKSTFMRLAEAAGWHNSKWLSGDPLIPGRRVFSPRVWLAEVGPIDLADGIVSHLSSITPGNEMEATHREYLNPCFSVVPVAHLTGAEQATARACLLRVIQGTDQTNWAGIARPFLSHIKDFVSAWRPSTSLKIGTGNHGASEFEVDLDASIAVYAGKRYPTN
jgi:hypothetical protein